MWKRVPQLKAVASVLFDFFTHLQGGRKTSRHRDNWSGRARREAGGLCAQEPGGSRNQNGPLHGGPWERTEKQTPGAECYGFSLGLSGGGRRGFGRDLRGQRENWKIVLLGSLSGVPTLSGDPSVLMY